MRGSVGASETLVRWVVRLSTWESEEKQRRSRKEEKRKWGKCCRHSNTHTQTRAHTPRAETHIHSTRELLRSFVRSFLRPSPRCGGGPGRLALPPSLPRLLGNPNHPTSRHVCSSLLLTFPPSSSHQNQCLLFLSSFLAFSLHPSIRPSVRPSSPPLSL